MTLLTPTIRAPGSELWFSWNPRLRADAVEQLLRSRTAGRPDAIEHPELPRSEVQIVRKANYTDNPHLPDELRAEAEYAKVNNPEQYGHIWLGGFEEAGSKIVIPPAWVEAAIGLVEDMGLVVTGKKRSALDVAGADEGGDQNAWAGQHGIELQELDTWNGYDTSLTTTEAVKRAQAYGSDENYYDSVSVGEGVTGEWAAMGRRDSEKKAHEPKERPAGMQLLPWNGGGAVLDPDEHSEPTVPGHVNRSPLNKDQYLNLKAYGWFRLRRKFYNAWLCRTGRPHDPEMMISISRKLKPTILAKLQDELSQPQQKPSATGKTMVDKQPDNAPSPNLADSVMMVNCPLPQEGYDLLAAL